VTDYLRGFLNIREGESAPLLWVTGLYFLILNSDIFLNHFTETVFLKRFGIHYLPVVYMTNAALTFFIMAGMTVVVMRVQVKRLLAYALLFCALTALLFRLLIPFGFHLLYPLLFILKAQFKAVLGILFWNLANTLFHARQSMRLFPLLTAGGVMGSISGSFLTPFISRSIPLDNFLLIHTGALLTAALTVRTWDPPFLKTSSDTHTVSSGSSNLFREWKKVAPVVKASRLVQILIVLSFIPNVILPIMNYQFRFVIDRYYATEGNLITFFGYFWGVQNSISLLVLLFVGNFYRQWGLPLALLFHPLNYVLAFCGFLFRFDLYAALYAKVSTNIFRTSMNRPASASLYGLLPRSVRSLVRSFLRGNIVRLGLFTGAALLVITEGLFHPRYLSFIGLFFGAGWVVAVLVLKKDYPRILINIITEQVGRGHRMEPYPSPLSFKKWDRIRCADLPEGAVSQIEKAFVDLALKYALRDFEETEERNLLLRHLDQKRWREMNSLLKAFPDPDHSSRLEIVRRGMISSDSRLRANSLEALAYLLEPALSQLLVPLMEVDPSRRVMSAARKRFHIPEFRNDETLLCSRLLRDGDWVTSLLAPCFARKEGICDRQIPESGDRERRVHIAENAGLLKKSPIFDELSVEELVAFARLARRKSYPVGVFPMESSPEGRLHLMASGEALLILEDDEGRKEEVMVEGGLCGELSLFQPPPYRMFMKVDRPSIILTFSGQDILDAAETYPAILMRIAGVLLRRITDLDEPKANRREKF
jgi:hypothetical protein